MTKALPLSSAYIFGIQHGLESQIKEIEMMNTDWEMSYTTSLRRSFVVELFEKNNIFEEFKSQHWPLGNTAEGQSKIRLYRKIYRRYQDYLVQPSEGSPVEELEDALSSTFALESHLQHFLVRNLEPVEKGLKPYRSEKESLEYRIDDGKGRIDILAVDSNGNYVVIELKLGTGRNKAIGQLLYYMGWIDANLSPKEGKNCRGILIASEISDDLKLAVRRTLGISIYRYSLSFSLEKAN